VLWEDQVLPRDDLVRHSVFLDIADTVGADLPDERCVGISEIELGVGQRDRRIHPHGHVHGRLNIRRFLVDLGIYEDPSGFSARAIVVGAPRVRSDVQSQRLAAVRVPGDGRDG
jgi:hypothetical protein